MSRDKAQQHAAHLAAAQALRPHLDAGRDVAMLNLGDVSIYATAAYLADILAADGYETRMVPGVTSFCAVAARLHTSLTASIPRCTSCRAAAAHWRNAWRSRAPRC